MDRLPEFEGLRQYREAKLKSYAARKDWAYPSTHDEANFYRQKFTVSGRTGESMKQWWKNRLLLLRTDPEWPSSGCVEIGACLVGGTLGFLLAGFVVSWISATIFSVGEPVAVTIKWIVAIVSGIWLSERVAQQFWKGRNKMSRRQKRRWLQRLAADPALPPVQPTITPNSSTS